MRTAAEGQAFRFSIQVQAEDSPEYSVSVDKALAVCLKVKPPGPGSLICLKGIQEAIAVRPELVQRGSPDMYFVTT